jgi:hypothetical protein
MWRRMDAQLHRPAAAQADPHHRPGTAGAVATGVIGGLTARFTAYLHGRLAETCEQFIDDCGAMLLSRMPSC